jgi:hypothetical protein
MRRRRWQNGAWVIANDCAESAIDILAMHKIVIVWDN